jgi:hypothetical protein
MAFKKRISVFLLILSAILLNCSKDISVEWTNIPNGGSNINTATAEFNIKIDAGLFASKKEDITIKWVWQNGTKTSSKVVSTSNRSCSDGDNVYTTYSATSGYILMNYYHVELYDSDDERISSSVSGYYYQ